MRFEELKQSLEDKVFPIYMLEGDDAFFRTRGVELIKKRCLQEPSLNYTKVEGANMKIEFESVITNLRVYPFMSEKRVVEISEWYPSATDLKQKNLKEYFDYPADSSVLIIVNSANSEVLKKLKNIIFIDCKRADIAFVCRYIKNRVEKSGINIEQSTCMKIAEYCLNDMTRVSQETQKLIDYSFFSKRITAESVELLINKDLDYKTYEIVEFIASHNFKNAYKIIDDISAPSEKQILFVSLYYHIRRMFYAAVTKKSVTEIASLLSCKEFAVKKAKEQAAKFTPKRLKKILDKISQCDFAFKCGALSLDNAFYAGVISVMCDA